MRYNTTLSHFLPAMKTWFCALLLPWLALSAGGCADLDLTTAVQQALETPTVRVTGAVVNLRAGPGLQHAVLDQVQAGDRLPVVGVSANGLWLQVAPQGEVRWIYADLTDVDPAVRQALPVPAAPSPPPVVPPAVEAPPEPTPVPVGAAPPPAEAPTIVYHPPGSYDRSLHQGLEYEWELVFTDHSALWDWEIVDFAGCYDALRVYLDALPAQRGLQRLEFVLSDPYVERDLLSYDTAVHTDRLVRSHYPTLKMDRETLFRQWPDWHAGNLPHPDFAFAAGICQNPSSAAEQICRIHPMWGRTGVTLDGSANLAMASVAAVSMTERWSLTWMRKRRAFASYLLPFDTRIGDPAGTGVCLHVVPLPGAPGSP